MAAAVSSAIATSSTPSEVACSSSSLTFRSHERPTTRQVLAGRHHLEGLHPDGPGRSEDDDALHLTTRRRPAARWPTSR